LLVEPTPAHPLAPALTSWPHPHDLPGPHSGILVEVLGAALVIGVVGIVPALITTAGGLGGGGPGVLGAGLVADLGVDGNGTSVGVGGGGGGRGRRAGLRAGLRVVKRDILNVQQVAACG
jgi:hypothetical protein